MQHSLSQVLARNAYSAVLAVVMSPNKKVSEYSYNEQYSYFEGCKAYEYACSEKPKGNNEPNHSPDCTLSVSEETLVYTRKWRTL